MFQTPKFFQGDKVKYVGSKFRQELGTKRGEVVSRVQNQPSAVVVDFGDDAYICSENSLQRFTPSPVVEEKEVDVMRRRHTDETE